MVERDNIKYDLISIPLTGKENEALMRKAYESNMFPLAYARNILTEAMVKWRQEQTEKVKAIGRKHK